VDAFNPLPSMEELKAALDGVKTASKELLTGPSVDSYAKSEVQRGFMPLRSLQQALTGANLPVDEKTGKVLKAERVDWFVVKIDGEKHEWLYKQNELSKVNQDNHAD
jgi:hypothetical protein